MEEWKTAIEDYEVSTYGHVRRRMKGGNFKEIKGSVQNNGYSYFQLIREGKRHNYLFHHLVAKCFISERPEGLVIDHIDRNKLNNRLDNLRYITYRENSFNTDRAVTDIPLDTPNRRNAVCKKYYDERKDAINASRRQKVLCDKCNKNVCKGHLKRHQIVCDGTGKRLKSDP